MGVIYAVLVLLLFAFGAIIMGLEIVSSNLMSPYFGGSVYIWGSIISSFMVHFSVGYVAAGYLSHRYPKVWVLAACLAVAALWVMAIPTLYKPVCSRLADGIADVRLGSLVAMNAIFFVPISLMAMVSPYVIGIMSGWGRRGLTAGMVLFISTVGSFFGTNLTAFYLISLFPVSRIVLGLGAIGLVVALAVLAAGVDRRIARLTGGA